MPACCFSALEERRLLGGKAIMTPRRAAQGRSAGHAARQDLQRILHLQIVLVGYQPGAATCCICPERASTPSGGKPLQPQGVPHKGAVHRHKTGAHQNHFKNPNRQLPCICSIIAWTAITSTTHMQATQSKLPHSISGICPHRQPHQTYCAVTGTPSTAHPETIIHGCMQVVESVWADVSHDSVSKPHVVSCTSK